MLHGRHHGGKSRLIQEIARPGDLYVLADQRDVPLQIQALADEIGRVIPQFASARYQSWDALLGTPRARVNKPLNLLWMSALIWQLPLQSFQV